MSNVPLPEPHHQSAANFNAPDEPFYTADQMHAHAAAVSAAKDAEIAGLRAEVAQLRERHQPDCRTCAKRSAMHIRTVCTLPRKHCTNGDHYEPLPPVRLWRTAP